MLRIIRLLCCITPAALVGAPVSMDLSGVKPGPVTVTAEGGYAVVRWQDNKQQPWEAQFDLEPGRPLIAAIRVNGRVVVQDVAPLYNCQIGKRRGGFDEFFDFPPSHPDGTRSYIAEFQSSSAKAVTNGDRVEISFEGFRMGSFRGSIRYVFFPGSRLIEQAAVA